MKINKPDFWDIKKPNLISKILNFFSYPVIYFSKLDRSKVKIQNIKTICVGNIYIGGTGKTPTSIAINDILKKLGYKTVFIKKFYENQKDEQKILKKGGNLICKKNRLDAIRKARSKKFEFALIFICPFPSYPRELVLSIPSLLMFLIEDIKSSVFFIKNHFGVLKPDLSAISFSLDRICAHLNTKLLGTTFVRLDNNSSDLEGMFSNSEVAQNTSLENSTNLT